METVVVVLMILVCFNFMMKQTFRKRGSVAAIAVVATLFVGLMWPYAIQQSKTQIADWLANVQLMLDTSVVLTVAIIPNMAVNALVRNNSSNRNSFSLVAWSMAAGVLILISAGTLFLRYLLPKKRR